MAAVDPRQRPRHAAVDERNAINHFDQDRAEAALPDQAVDAIGSQRQVAARELVAIGASRCQVTGSARRVAPAGWYAF